MDIIIDIMYNIYEATFILQYEIPIPIILFNTFNYFFLQFF